MRDHSAAGGSSSACGLGFGSGGRDLECAADDRTDISRCPTL